MINCHLPHRAHETKICTYVPIIRLSGVATPSVVPRSTPSVAPSPDGHHRAPLLQPLPLLRCRGAGATQLCGPTRAGPGGMKRPDGLGKVTKQKKQRSKQSKANKKAEKQVLAASWGLNVSSRNKTNMSQNEKLENYARKQPQIYMKHHETVCWCQMIWKNKHMKCFVDTQWCACEWFWKNTTNKLPQTHPPWHAAWPSAEGPEGSGSYKGEF